MRGTLKFFLEQMTKRVVSAVFVFFTLISTLQIYNKKYKLTRQQGTIVLRSEDY